MDKQKWVGGWTGQEVLHRDDDDGTSWEIAPYRTLNPNGEGWMNCYKMTLTHPVGIFVNSLHPTIEHALEHCDQYLREFSRKLRSWMDEAGGSVDEAESKDPGNKPGP